MMLYPALWVRINDIHIFEFFSFLVYLRCTLNDIDSQAQVEQGGVFFWGGNKSSEDTCILISVYGHVFYRLQENRTPR